MSRVILLNPAGLVAQELLEALQENPLGRDVKLLSLDEKQIGQLTEAAGAAALVGRADEAALASADAVVVLGEVGPHRSLLDGLGDEATIVLAASDATPDDGPAVVAGVNLDAARPGTVMVSPDAGAVLLAHLLAPLVRDTEDEAPRLTRAVATLVRPASTFDRPGLDELFAQAGRMVAMQSQQPSALFDDRQLAFNLYPAPDPPPHLAAQLGQVLGGDAELAVHVLQGGVFHGTSALVHVTLTDRQAADPAGAKALAERLAASPWITLADADDGAPAPIDVAGETGLLLATVHPDASGAGYWLWAVMDNLTRGGALNVLEILEAVLPADA